jgi:hypothetical protein
MVIWQQYLGPADDWDRYVAALMGSFYQTYGWGEVRRLRGWQPLRLLAYRGKQIIAAASVMVKTKFGLSVCWVPGGPIGALESLEFDFLPAVSRAVGTRLVYCRLSLLRPDQGHETCRFEDAGWHRPSTTLSSGLTMSYSLIGGESERLQKTSGNWRHNLRRSARYGLRIEHWENPDPEAIATLYREMESLKSIPVQHSAAELAAIFDQCREHLIIYRCLDDFGHLLAIRAAALCGATALDLLAAAGGKARKVYASYATLWALLDHCSRLGLSEYDLGGVDIIDNKGVFDFKHGTGATTIKYLGEWEKSTAPGLRQAVNWLLEIK